MSEELKNCTCIKTNRSSLRKLSETENIQFSPYLSIYHKYPCGQLKTSRIPTGGCVAQRAVLDKNKEELLYFLNNGLNPDCFHGPDIYRSPLLDILLKPGHIDMGLVKMLIYFGASLQGPLYPHLIHYVMQSNISIVLLTFLIGAGIEMPPDYKTLMISLRNTEYCKTPQLTRNVLNLISFTGICCGFENEGRYHNPDHWQKPRLYLNNTASGIRLQDWCRITVRNVLIKSSGGRCILPNLIELPLPALLKEYVSFNTFCDFQYFVKLNLKNMTKT